MDKQRRVGLAVGLLVVAAVVVLVAGWYLRLEEGERRHVRNLVRQVPALPGRYAV